MSQGIIDAMGALADKLHITTPKPAAAAAPNDPRTGLPADAPDWQKNNYSYPEDRVTKSPPGNVLQKRKPLINRSA